MRHWFLALLFLTIAWPSLVGLTDLEQGLALFLMAVMLWTSRLLGELPGMVVIPVLALLLQLITPIDLAQVLMSPVLAIFIFGFSFATLSREQKLDRLALTLLSRLSGEDERRACRLLFAMTGLISMWTSNVVTTALMLPLAMSIALTATDPHRVGKIQFLSIGIAFSATLGGMATQVGSSTSLIASELAGVDFIGWLVTAAPIALLLWLLMVWMLERHFSPDFSQPLTLPQAPAITRAQKESLVIVLLTLIGWVGGALALRGMSKAYALVPLFSVAVLMLRGLITPAGVVKSMKWRVITIFVCAITLGKVLHDSGGGNQLVEWLSPLLFDLPLMLQIGVFLLLICVFTEYMSNVASASLLAPLMLLLLQPQGASLTQISALVGIGCSLAFVLPSATPANTLVVGSGNVTPQGLRGFGLKYKISAALVLTLVIWAMSLVR
ncbi:SLC13 family permease [Ferrimonas sp. YFM]|uniref:SLC13 family permease n=1 Tax=Ferrimonas sp. YFM TaxID=3028878 RepID=UPI0025731913|nr:SLC13 family permease [Ferrimonas sp. YFM]BDY06289.1 transporter divalent anion:Na+ symporter family protein [Ferrimonas sp. YFM]